MPFKYFFATYIKAYNKNELESFEVLQKYYMQLR